MSFLPENILLLICGLGVLQGILLAALLYFHPKSDRSVNVFLALHIFFICFAMSTPFAIEFITWQRGNFMQAGLLLAPIFLYFYVRSFKERITFKKALPHVLIFLLFVFALSISVSSLVKKYPNERIPPREVFYQPLNIAIPIIRIGLKVFYYLLARRTIISYQKSIRQLYSETSRINLGWARVLLNGYLFIVVTGIVIYLLMLLYPEQFNLLLLINVAVATPYIYIATYKGITQPTIWQLQHGTTKEEVEEKIQETTEVASDISNQRSKLKTTDKHKVGKIAKQVVALLEDEKLYQETELTLQQLGDKLGLQTYIVSQAINEVLKKNFYDLVNNYRVEEAKRLLLDPKNVNYTVLSVGFEAGFNSKTTFNTVFKKFTGLTPTEYRDKQKISSVPA